MAADIVKVSKYAALGVVIETLHEVYKGRTLTVSMIHLVNTTAVDVTVQVHLVPFGEVATQANSILYDYTIPAHDFIELGEGFLLLDRGTLQAVASGANAVNLHFSGLEE